MINNKNIIKKLIYYNIQILYYNIILLLSVLFFSEKIKKKKCI